MIKIQSQLYGNDDYRSNQGNSIYNYLHNEKIVAFDNIAGIVRLTDYNTKP